MLDLEKIKAFYLREDVQEAILANAKDREVAVKFGDGGFGKRPDMLQYAQDIVELAKQGATSFHASEERWKNPLMLNPLMKRGDMEALRIGWDLLIDIDCGIFEYSRIAAHLIIKLLQFHKVSAISCKFSGNKGFHIGVPFEAFPKKIQDQESAFLFPDAPKNIALYIREMIKKRLGEQIMEHENNDFTTVIKKTGKKAKDITYQPEPGTKSLNAEPFLEIDTLLISSRHLYRMPYSFNEKSGLVSVVVDPEKVMDFTKDQAQPENIRDVKKFLVRKAGENEAGPLVLHSYDFNIKQDEKKPRREYQEITDKIHQDFFPPCIQKILKGLEDGRKRALFILINFLKNVGWPHDDIEKLILEWNKKNKEPLHLTYLQSQLNYQKGRKPILPPNCHNNMYYTDMRVKCEESICRRFKNPVNYTVRRTKFMKKEK